MGRKEREERTVPRKKFAHLFNFQKQGCRRQGLNPTWILFPQMTESIQRFGKRKVSIWYNAVAKNTHPEPHCRCSKPEPVIQGLFYLEQATSGVYVSCPHTKPTLKCPVLYLNECMCLHVCACFPNMPHTAVSNCCCFG